MAIDWLAWAHRFISTPSVSSAGNVAIAELARELLGESGIESRIDTATVGGVTHHALTADLGPRDGDDGLLLVTHLDTVPPGDAADWTATGGDPFAPTRDGDRLYGLGSADAKVDLVAKVAGLEKLGLSRLGRRVRILGTFGEEIGLLGARFAVARGDTAGFCYALVGEPSELTAIRAHKGYAKFSARVAVESAPVATGSVAVVSNTRGVSAHSSTPHLGSNAIEAALEALASDGVLGFVELEGGGAVNKVPDRCHLVRVERGGRGRPVERAIGAKPLLEFLRVWREQRDAWRGQRCADFDPDHTVGNLGRVVARDGYVELGFDVRPVPGLDLEAAVAPLRAVAEISLERSNPPLSTPPDSPLLSALVDAQTAAGIGARIATKATCTEAGLLAEAGVEAVVFGAGVSVGNVHRPNEYTLLGQLEAARDIYAHAIGALCGGT